ncbi:MAG: TatD family hydrolase [Alphaproteobacteria bacterium]|nr:TatD family hydrolase [Alphaproteobacteria bacterium]
MNLNQPELSNHQNPNIMAFFIDTHCHVYLEEFKNNLSEKMQAAINHNIQQFWMPSIHKNYFETMVKVAQEYPSNCLLMIGLHPCYVKDNFEEELDFVKHQLATQQHKFIAIGEIGLDLYWDKTNLSNQIKVFETQLEWALHYHLPVSIHCREAMGEAINIVKPFADRGLRGIFHCFGGSLAEAQAIIDMNFLLGIGGVATFKKSDLISVLQKVPLTSWVLETDAPYLAPNPFRGKINEPAFLKYTIDHLVSKLDMSCETLAESTSQNALQLLNTNKL